MRLHRTKSLVLLSTVEATWMFLDPRNLHVQLLDPLTSLINKAPLVPNREPLKALTQHTGSHPWDHICQPIKHRMKGDSYRDKPTPGKAVRSPVPISDFPMTSVVYRSPWDRLGQILVELNGTILY